VVEEGDEAVALFESLSVTFEDVEEFLDDGLVNGVVVPDDDVAIPHISTDGDVVVFLRGRRFLVGCHLVFLRGRPRCPLIIRPLFWLLSSFSQFAVASVIVTKIASQNVSIRK
jgi:hypothetical protein